eukprot:scaffold34633_cov25-Tisochrysis_lutea.AAC.2
MYLRGLLPRVTPLSSAQLCAATSPPPRLSERASPLSAPPPARIQLASPHLTLRRRTPQRTFPPRCATSVQAHAQELAHPPIHPLRLASACAAAAGGFAADLSRAVARA